MIWPFKPRERVLSFNEFVETQPDTPCGEKRFHYDWTIQRRWPCPACAAIKDREKTEAEEARLVEKIALRVAAELKKQEGGE